ncbi:MAG: hypothetical protein QXT45_05870 [Candidatus Bilamarchaeaceae archaeon]
MEVTQAVKSAVYQAFQDRSDLLDKAKQAMGETLLEYIRVAYIQKSKGMADAAGERWVPTKAFKEGRGFILFKTGKLFESLHVELTDKGFNIAFDLEYGAIQFKKRHPVPRQIPEEWLKAMVDAAKPYIREIIIDGIRRVEEFKVQSIETEDR